MNKNVSALFRAAKVATAPSPYDTIHLKIFYPAQISASDRPQKMGIVPPDPTRSPFPVVIFFNGVNCYPEMYQWLAIKLVERGLVVVTFSWVSENIPGMISISPGVDLAMLTPDRYGHGPTASALPTLIAELSRLQSQSILARMLDLEKIILGGHSAGGRVAIESADRRFFDQVVAAFAYGAHTAAGTMMGYEPGTILPLPDTLPLMLIGGTCDGVIANSSDLYGLIWERPTTPISRTFSEAIAGGRNDSYLLLIEGANHYAIVDPLDATTGATGLDFPATQPLEKIRELIAKTIGCFIDTHVRSQPDISPDLNIDPTNPLVAAFEQK